MVSKSDMLKALTKDQLLAIAKKKKVKVAKSWTKDEIAAKLPFDAIRAAYSTIKSKSSKKTSKKKVTKKRKK